jgi:hypothetical protein
MDCHDLCSSEIVTKGRKIILFRYFPPTTQTVTVHVIGPVPYKMDNSKELFILHATAPII